MLRSLALALLVASLPAQSAYLERDTHQPPGDPAETAGVASVLTANLRTRFMLVLDMPAGPQHPCFRETRGFLLGIDRSRIPMPFMEGNGLLVYPLVTYVRSIEPLDWSRFWEWIRYIEGNGWWLDSSMIGASAYLQSVRWYEQTSRVGQCARVGPQVMLGSVKLGSRYVLSIDP